MARLNNIVGGKNRLAPDTPGKARPHPELSVVSLVRDVEVNGRTFPAGARGTVLAAYADGKGYEVEVFEPVHGVITVETQDIAG